MHARMTQQGEKKAVKAVQRKISTIKGCLCWRS